MKQVLSIILILFSFQIITISQQDPQFTDRQFMLGVIGVETEENVTHNIRALGEVWELNESNEIILGGIYQSSLTTEGNSNMSKLTTWPGFCFEWQDAIPYWSLGLYKVTNSIQPSKYFYLDSRDSKYPFPGTSDYNTPDFWIYFDNDNGVYRYESNNQVIPNGSLVTVWDIHNVTPNTAGLPSFWNNALAVARETNPKLIWGPYPTNNLEVVSYKIYRATVDNTVPPPTPIFSLIQTVDANIYEYKDFDFAIGSVFNLYYKITAVVYDAELGITYETDASNTEKIGGAIYKNNSDKFLKDPSETVLSIDFTEDGSILYSLSVRDSFASVIKFNNENDYTEWNISEMFNRDYSNIASDVGPDGTIYAVMNDYLFKFNGDDWDSLKLPESGYYKYPFITEDKDNNVWISNWSYGFENNLMKVKGDEVTIYSKDIDFGRSVGRVYEYGDVIFICSSNGLFKYENDQFTKFDFSKSEFTIGSAASFFIDSQGRRWIGSANAGLIEWVNDSTFIQYNTENSDLASNFINAIDEDSQGRIWLATDAGIASLENGTITKHEFVEEIFSIPILKVDAEDNIWFGTLDDGLFKYDGANFTPITNVEEKNILPKSYYISQNYPNPFNPSTTIEYSIPNKGLVQIKVFDILGNEIKTLINADKPAGSYKIAFNAVNLSSGVYFYRITSGNFSETKKMVLLR